MFVEIHASNVFDPFEDLVKWLDQVDLGGFPQLWINTEGDFWMFELSAVADDIVSFTISHKTRLRTTYELTTATDRSTLVAAFYCSLVMFWESDALLKEWGAWDFEANATITLIHGPKGEVIEGDAQYPDHLPYDRFRPYPIRSESLDRKYSVAT